MSTSGSIFFQQGGSPETALEVIQRACGDKAYMLDKPPYGKAIFEIHEDDVSLGSGKPAQVIGIKLLLGTDRDLENNIDITIWAYLFQNTDTERATRVGYLGLNADDELVQYVDRYLVRYATLSDIFPANCAAGMIPALVKYYFYKTEVEFLFIPTFSKSNAEDLIRACGRFDTSVPFARRETRAPSRKSQVGLGASRDLSSLLFPENENQSMMPRTTSPEFTVQESNDSDQENQVPVANMYPKRTQFEDRNTTGSRNTLFSQLVKAYEEEESLKHQLETLAAAGEEQERKRDGVKAKLNAQKKSEAQKLQIAQASKQQLAGQADPEIKKAIEFGIDLGHKESERKRRRTD
ncbi:unnamed protein product [Periconia digitata]|uniref:Uncharacterized protein n=1 Tax=Periconia digitata TaxID=1303443 RepID=A0A9W4UEP0_9PLEO|nr:unnamed protein product [Periconia digitata]